MKNKPPICHPPYDSPLEDDFAYHLTKYLEPTVFFVPQFEVKTICGTFRIDFVVQSPMGLIGFECDGKEFHDSSRDEWRDAMILGSNGVNAIYRLRGADLYYHIDDVIYVVSRWNPELFSQRGLLNLESLASDAVRSESEEYTKSVVFIRYHEDENQAPLDVVVRRRFLHSDPNRRQFMQTAYNFACSVGGGNLDDVMSQYRAQKCDDELDW